MTKRGLIEEMTARYPGYTKREVETMVDTVFQILTAALMDGARIELRGFGSFQTTYRPAREARNPRTGACVSVPAKRVPVFKVSKVLHARINGQERLSERHRETAGAPEHGISQPAHKTK